MKAAIIPIQSITDIITNSSTEVFLLNLEDAEQFEKDYDYRKGYFDEFKTIEDVRKYVEKDDCEELDAFMEYNPYCSWNAGNVISVMKEKANKTDDQIWDFFKDLYVGLVGKAILVCDNCWDMCNEIRDWCEKNKKPYKEAGL